MPEETPVFRPERERKLLFRDREIATADLKDGRGYVSVRSLCEAFGLDQRAQRKRLLRQQGYFEPYTATIIITTPGGPQPSLCLMASAVPIFLTGVELERLQDEEPRALLKAFLDEAHTVLAEHFGISERGELRFMRDSLARMVAEQEAFEEGMLKKVDAELAEIRLALAGLDVPREELDTLQQATLQLDELFLLVVVGEFNAGKSATNYWSKMSGGKPRTRSAAARASMRARFARTSDRPATV